MSSAMFRISGHGVYASNDTLSKKHTGPPNSDCLLVHRSTGVVSLRATGFEFDPLPAAMETTDADDDDENGNTGNTNNRVRRCGVLSDRRDPV